MAYALVILMLLPFTPYGLENSSGEPKVGEYELAERIMPHDGSTISYPPSIVEERNSRKTLVAEDNILDGEESLVSTLSNTFSIIVNGIVILGDRNSSSTGWSYDASTITLTLDGYNGSKISTSGDLVVYVKNNSTIRGSNGTYGENAIVASNLEINVEDGKALNIYGGNATTYSGGDGVSVDNYEISVGTGASLNITGGAGAISNGGDGIYSRGNVDIYLKSNSTTSIKGGSTSSGMYGGDGINTYNTYIDSYGGVISITGGYGQYGGAGLDCLEAYIFGSNSQSNSINGGPGSLGGGYGIYYYGKLYFGYGQSLSINGGQKLGLAIGSYSDGEWAAEPWEASEHLNTTINAYKITMSPITYTITLDGNGGVINNKGTINLFGQYPEDFDLKNYIFEKPGYKQIGWLSELYPGVYLPIDAWAWFNANKTFSAMYAPIIPNKIALVGNGEWINGEPYLHINENENLPYIDDTWHVGWTDKLTDSYIVERLLGINELFFPPRIG